MPISDSILAQLEDKNQYKWLSDSLISVIKKSTIPILVNQGEIYRQHGTGTLLRVAERSFLVTAAHVFRSAQQNNLTLYIGASESKVVPLSGKFYYTPGGEDDPYDLGVRELSQSVVDNLKSLEFARLLDVITPSKIDPDDLYCLAGFPTLLSKEASSEQAMAESKTMLIVSHCYRGSTTALPNYDPKFHILLHGDRNDAVPIDGTNQTVPAKLNGISGCGIWKTNIALVERIQDWRLSSARLIAIQTCVYERSQVIRGTFWSGVVTLIEREFPELVPAVNLLLPRPNY